ncbi:hypothetical protein VTK56DRAFT_180 [Thermocarpiscus australiensis]
MASGRLGTQAFGWSGNSGPRYPRADVEIQNGEAKFDSRWKTKREAETSNKPARAIPQPNFSSRLPQSLSHRRPSDSQAELLRLGQQSRVRTSTCSASSLAAAEMSGPPSSASASSRLPGPTLKRRNVLRRKRSGLSSQDMGSTRHDSRNNSTGASSSDSNTPYQTPLDSSVTPHLDRELTQSPTEIRVAQQVEISKTTVQAVTIYPELDRYRDVNPPLRAESPGSCVPYRIATQDLPPPTPLFSGTSSLISGISGSPSTWWSGSPGPGPYSRDTTPTSISSQSPGLVVPTRIPPPAARVRQADPALTRLPATRRRAGSVSNEVCPVSAEPQGLAVVRELSTSSSSNSTVRADGDTKEKNKRRKGPPQHPPSPPPRKSSHSSKGSRDDDVKAFKSSSPVPVKDTSYSGSRTIRGTQPAAPAKSTPPVRPSRDGTLDLQAQLGRPTPVIHSSLSATSLPERRQSGLLAPGPASRRALSPSLSDRPVLLAQRPPTRELTPAPVSATSSDATGTPKQELQRPARAPSPSVPSSKKTRFPIFGRRAKTVTEPSQQEKKERPARKGPAAGTGHEGYGRLGSVRRRSSTVSSPARVIPGTMSSQESLSSTQSHDPFLMERMAPVIIAGGEVIENRNRNTTSELTRTESNQSSTLRRPSIGSRNSSQVSLPSRENPHKTLWPSPFPRGFAQTVSVSGRRPSESSDSEAPAMKPTLALRRSIQRLKSGEHEPVRLPKPIATRPQVLSPSVTSLDASIMSDDSILKPPADLTVATKEAASTMTRSGPKKLVKRAKSPRKWNLFGRSQDNLAVGKATDRTKTVAATVKVVQTKSLAFYTMMDSSELEDADTPDLEEVLREVRGTATAFEKPPVEDAEIKRRLATQDPASPRQTTLEQGDQQPSTNPKRTVATPATLPSPPVSQVKSEPAAAPQPDQQRLPPQQTSDRPSRLPQVGRIPKVVSRRAQQISPKSFSRPFHRLSAHMPPARDDLQDVDSVAKGPSPPKPSTPEPAYEHLATVSESNISALIYGVPRLLPPVANQPGREFLSFSPRKGSQCTTTTTSSSSGGLLAYADSTAIVPEPDAPLAEDEIWDEYNDLFGEDTIRLSTSEGRTWPKPLRLEGSEQGNGKPIDPPLGSPTLSPPPLPSLVQALRSGMGHPSPSTSGSGLAEEIKQVLDSDEAKPALVTDPSNRQSKQLRESVAGKQTQGSIPAQLNSTTSDRQARRSDASGSSQGSEDSSRLSQVNLRVGSMTVSKWLTFGHVLFSPVRDELVSVEGSLKRPSILVIDGLGNDDWSFYAAETYPAATFFNLSPRAPLSAAHRTDSSFPLTPPNHHQVQYMSHTEKFPFGAQSFTSVVFRFPAAAPESHYRNIISEARRVLKPGGYIELSILDVDLNNMGNRCRRAVRRLKECIHARAPDTSLGPVSDLILRLMGRRGYTDIKTCRVGVPIASTIARSPSSETGTGGKRSLTGAGGRGKGTSKKDERSLPEMISDEGPVADENIAKQVAKVGRWWYTRCYESAAAPGVGPGSRSSMWRDKALLAECEEWGTSLKLMVCHARVPDGRARVASI